MQEGVAHSSKEKMESSAEESLYAVRRRCVRFSDPIDFCSRA